MHIAITNKCKGCGICATLSPEVFDVCGNFAVANPDKVKDNEESCIDAAISCPCNAIIIN